MLSAGWQLAKRKIIHCSACNITFHAGRALQDPGIELKVKLHIIKTFIKPVATYDMEIWDARKCDACDTEAINHLDVARRILLTMLLPTGPCAGSCDLSAHSNTGVVASGMTCLLHTIYMRKIEANLAYIPDGCGR
jgi:hypothetical protein